MSASETSVVARGALRQARDRHLGRLLLRASRAFNARAVEHLRARGYHGLTQAHVGLLPHLDEEGTRITTLAERAAMTKQGMGQLVLDLERLGYLARGPDETDRRATLVHFTAAGRRLLTDAVEIVAELETEYAAVLGENQLRHLRSALERLLDHEERRERAAVASRASR